MFRVGPLQIIPEESESAKDSQTSKDRTRQAAFVKAASNFADEAANTHCRLHVSFFLSTLVCTYSGLSPSHSFVLLILL